MTPEHKAALAEGRRRAAAERAEKREELGEARRAYWKTESRYATKMMMARGTEGYQEAVRDYRMILAAMPRTVEDVA